MVNCKKCIVNLHKKYRVQRRVKMKTCFLLTEIYEILNRWWIKRTVRCFETLIWVRNYILYICIYLYTYNIILVY